MLTMAKRTDFVDRPAPVGLSMKSVLLAMVSAISQMLITCWDITSSNWSNAMQWTLGKASNFG